jgi:hypothetical protein
MLKPMSPYLNLFQPFPERDVDLAAVGGGEARAAIEDNMSRAVFCVVAHGNPGDAAGFIEALTEGSSPKLEEKVRRISAIIAEASGQEVEVGLQSWPGEALDKLDPSRILLVGVSSGHQDQWTHDTRDRPEHPRPDAWIHVPGECLVVFEFKNDMHPLDATQIGYYAIRLGLLDASKLTFPFPAAHQKLASKEQAAEVQRRSRDVVVDASWNQVVDYLLALSNDAHASTSRRLLASNAHGYLDANVAAPYRSPGSILRWLQNEANDSRKAHLRWMVAKLAEDLGNAAGDEGYVIGQKKGAWDIRTGAASAAYAPLRRKGNQPISVTFLGKEVEPVLWFAFAEGDKEPVVGIELYAQSSGAAVKGKDYELRAWKAASKRHMGEKLDEFRTLFGAWCKAHAGLSATITFTAVKYRGSAPNWQGGGKEAEDSPAIAETPIGDAPDVFERNLDKLWRFHVPQSEDVLSPKGRRAMTAQVRKAGISLIAQTEGLDVHDESLTIEQFQDLLRRSLAMLS